MKYQALVLASVMALASANIFANEEGAPVAGSAPNQEITAPTGKAPAPGKEKHLHQKKGKKNHKPQSH